MKLKILLSCCSLYDQIFKPSKLPGNADFHLFKAGIEPKWEDPECANGGKWSVTINRKPILDNMWLETVGFLSPDCYVYKFSLIYSRWVVVWLTEQFLLGR